jgi:UDPglucose--hexose-1-phosphate uridylyltransferase
VSVVHRRELRKPDGRRLWLYGRAPIDPAIEAPSPIDEAAQHGNPHLRWHPLREEWVAYAAHRQSRTFLPPPEYNPLAPTVPGRPPTEVPSGDYDVAVFENRFATLRADAHDPPRSIVPTAPARGACEVVVFTQDPAGSLGGLPWAHVELILSVWADRTRELGARDDVAAVMPFENRGVEVGVTLRHPHGQIYAYPFVPPVIAREASAQGAHYDRHGRPLLVALVEAELADGARVIYAGPRAIAFVPAFARYAYEVWIAPRAPTPSLVELDDETRADMARALKLVLTRFDALWSRPFPYVMVVHQAPTDGRDHPEWQLHVELYPAFRMPGRLKYLAGSELGAGAFTADTLPEDKARELRVEARRP